MSKKVLICIPKCNGYDKANEFDEVFEVENLLNTKEVSKNPMGYITTLMSFASKGGDEAEMTEVLSKVLDKKFLELMLSKEDKEIHLCMKNKGVQSVLIEMLLSTIKDKKSVYIEKC